MLLERTGNCEFVGGLDENRRNRRKFVLVVDTNNKNKNRTNAHKPEKRKEQVEGSVSRSASDVSGIKLASCSAWRKSPQPKETAKKHI